jgi:RND family efflux transporter MFP subunit
VARQQLARAEHDLSETRLLAPFAGEVAAVQARVGQRTQANAPLVSLVALEVIRVPAEVLESDFGRLRTGAQARLRFPALPGETFEGKIAALSPRLDPQRGTGIAWVQLPNPQGRIRPGMYADVEIDADVFQGRLSVPRDAVLERDRRLLVFRTKGERAEWQYVQTGLENDARIEITSGLAEGDTVLVEGHLTLAHGARVDVSLRRD